jgi:L-cystine transport system substrate-binding protein
MMKRFLGMAGMVLLGMALALPLLSCKKNLGEQAGTGSAEARSAAVKTVVVGTGNKYEPYCYLDANGNLTGFDKAVADEIDKRLPEYKFVYEMFDFANVLVSLNTGKVDIGLHEFEENPERRKIYLYGEEGYNDYDSYFVISATGSYTDVTSLDDIAGKPNLHIGVNAGSNHEAFIKTYNSTHDADHQIAFEVYGEGNIIYQNIATGRIVGMLSTLEDVDRINTILPNLNIKALGEPVIVSKAYIIFRKDNPELQQAVDRAIREIRADGTLEKIKRDVFAEYYKTLK